MLGLSIHKVVGDSMFPTYHSGDYLLCFSWGKRRFLKPGDVVVLDHHKYGRIVKRVVEIKGTDHIALTGDGMHSVSDQELGLVSMEDIVTKVILRIS